MAVASHGSEVSSPSRLRWWVVVAISPAVALAVTYAVGTVHAIWRAVYVEQERWESGPAGWTLVAEPGTVSVYPDRVVGGLWVLIIAWFAGLVVARAAAVRAWPVVLLVGAASTSTVMVSTWWPAWWPQVLIVAAATVLGLCWGRSLEPPVPTRRPLELVVVLGVPVSVAASLLMSGIAGVDLLGPVDEALTWAVPTLLAGLLTGLVLAWLAVVERRRRWIVALAAGFLPALVVLAGASPAWPIVQLAMIMGAAGAVGMLRRPATTLAGASDREQVTHDGTKLEARTGDGQREQ